MNDKAGAGVVLSAMMMLGVAACGPSETGSPSGGGTGGATTTTPSGGTAGAGGAPVTSAYDPDHVIEVAITMAPAEWDALRFEVNDLDAVLGGDCLAGPKPGAFNYHPGSATIDGQEFADIEVRKKGFVGSLSVSRPSLKLRLDAADPEARFHETAKLTLNNMKQDASKIRTCLALGMFANAGVPASRCSFAHVTVNGEDLGVYTNVEGIGGAELAERFPDGTGNLYEGVMSDFLTDWQDTYEKKTNEIDPDRSDLQALTTALDAPDGELLSSVEPVLDLDAFLSFWAMESLLQSWDGYTNGQNNHLVYHEPSTGKMYFLPWGPDATFGSGGGELPPGKPLSVYATSALPRRLYALPEVRSQYRDRLLELLDKTFTSGAATAEIDRMETLLTPYFGAAGSRWKDEVAAVRTWTVDRPATIQAEVKTGPAEYPFAPAGSPCLVSSGTVTGTFTTTMGTLEKNNPFGTGDATVHLDLAGMVSDSGLSGAAVSFNNDTPTLLVLGVMPGGKYAIFVFLVDPTLFAPGDVPVDLQQVFGVYGTSGADGAFQQLAWLDHGTVHLDKAGLKDGDEVTGTFTTELYTPAP